MFQQPAVADDLQGEVRQGHELDLGPLGLVMDHALFVVDLDLVAVCDLVQRVGQLDQVEPAVDALR